MKERRTSIRFDKAFPVYLSGEEGLTRGIARNISDGGMFIETREPYRLGARIKITFVAADTNTEITMHGEVRFQCFLSYGVGEQGGESQLRGMGIRFVKSNEYELGFTPNTTTSKSSSNMRILH